MKRILFAIIAAVLSGIVVKAVPAYPGPVKYRQPDGSVIEIVLHGDEYYHYTTCNGKVVALGEDGFYHPSSKPVRNSAEICKARSAAMNRAPRRASSENLLSVGEKRFLILLIEFSDLHFTVPDPKAAFTALLNEKGYSANGGTGSAYDYYYENSKGKFKPSFDVYGPIPLNKSYADYGKNRTDDNGARLGDTDPSGVLADAALIAHSKGMLNFADYDNDGDGYVDNVFFYFAGHNEAEGGGEDTIWPHASYIQGSSLFNGVRLGSYACTSEYRGSNSSTTMAGIGTFCHEFGHVLGLPDFYDCDYEENGSANTVYSFSLMCEGNYNNNGRTPPYLGALERWMLGWMDEPSTWTATGSKTIRPVHENQGYKTPTSVQGEFFLYEVRDGSGWDSYIKMKSSDQAPSGLLIYHVDMSDNAVGSYSAASLWQSNSLNNYGSHPCYYIERPTTSYNSYTDMMYPGTTGTTSFEGVDWAKQATGYILSNISYSNGTVSLDLLAPDSIIFSGKVVDSKGRTLEGVKVDIIPEDSEGVQQLKSRRSMVSLRELQSASVSYNGHTASDGTYSIVVPSEAGTKFTISFSMPYYTTSNKTVTVSGSKVVTDAIMYDLTEGVPSSLCKHATPGSALGFTQEADSYTATIAVKFSAAELTSVQGNRFNTIRYMLGGTGVKQLDVFIDFGKDRVFTRTVARPQMGSIQTVDISDAGITVPEGKDVYIGCAVKEIKGQYWISIDSGDGVPGGGVYSSEFLTSGNSNWSDLGYNLIIDSEVQEMKSPFDGLGAKILLNPGKGEAYPVGTRFNLGFENPNAGETPSSITWYFDGTHVEGSVITLSDIGVHTVKAVLEYEDGSIEQITQQIKVQ